MEEEKSYISPTQEDFGLSSKLFPKSILKTKDSPIKTVTQKFIRKSKTMDECSNNKKVSFPDKFKKPLHTIFEVERVIYQDSDIKPEKKLKSKGCACIIF